MYCFGDMFLAVCGAGWRAGTVTMLTSSNATSLCTAMYVSVRRVAVYAICVLLFALYHSRSGVSQTIHFVVCVMQ